MAFVGRWLAVAVVTVVFLVENSKVDQYLLLLRAFFFVTPAVKLDALLEGSLFAILLQFLDQVLTIFIGALPLKKDYL
jgi:hypothetical protein